MYNYIKTNKKKLLLILIPIELVFIILYYKNIVHYMRYFVLNISFIIFYNFPNILISLHKKPIYYDDLIIKSYLHDEENINEKYIDKYKIWYQNIFKWVVLISSPIICAILTDIWFVKAAFINNNSNDNQNYKKYLNPSIAAALAIIFSLGSLYLKISILFGKFLIKILKLYRSYDLNKLVQKSNNKINVLNINFDYKYNNSPRLSKSCIELSNLATIPQDNPNIV